MARKEKANKKQEETLDIELVRDRLKAIDKKVELLAEKVVENNSNKKLAKTNSKSSTVVKKSPPLPGDIEIPKKDKNYTSPTNNVVAGSVGFYSKFSSNMVGNVLKSKMFWILLITLPMLFMFIEYIMYCQVPEDGGASYSMVNKTTFAYDYMNWAIISPLFVLGLIIYPTFIGQSRENNLLKRYALIGMSRKQFYYSYMFFTTVFLLVLIAFWFGPWLYIMNEMIGQLFADSTTVAKKDNIYDLFSEIRIARFAIILIFSMLAINSLGYKKAMSVKSSTKLMGWGIGLWIFALMSSSFSFLLAFNLWQIPVVPTNAVANIIVTTILFVVKWMFLFSIPSLVSFALIQSLTDMWTPLNNAFTIDNTPWDGITPTPPENFLDQTTFNSLIMLITALVIIVSIVTTLSVWVNKSKIVSYEATR